jgi:uncharacterized membrane protein
VVEELPRPSQSIAFNRSGYIQTIDYGSLVSCAKDADVVLEIPVRAGHFAVRRGICAKVLTDGSLPEDAAKQIRHAFVIGSERSPAQDLEFSIRQLVEIALRALSPGINDPFTAIAVVDRLAAALEDVFSRDIQPRLLFDEQSCLRVVADRSDVEGLVSACFDQLRQAAIRNPGVLIHLADTLGKIAPLAEGEAASRAILSQLERLHESVGKTELGDTDRQILSQRIEKARSALSRS